MPRQQRHDGNCQTEDDPNASRQAIHPVDQVQGIGGSQYPEQRERDGQNPQLDSPIENRDLLDQQAGRKYDNACKHLARELLTTAQSKTVVEQTETANHCGGQQEAPQENRILRKPLSPARRIRKCHNQGQAAAPDHRQPAAQRNWAAVQLAMLVGFVHHAQSLGHPAHHRRQQ